MELATDGLEVLAAMAAPAVLLLGNAMLILSTNQRLPGVLDRVPEPELAIVGRDAGLGTADPTSRRRTRPTDPSSRSSAIRASPQSVASCVGRASTNSRSCSACSAAR